MYQFVAGLQRAAVFAQENARGFGIFFEAFDGGIKNIGISTGQYKSLTGEFNRRRHYLLARQFAVFFLHGIYAQYRTWHACGEIAIQTGPFLHVAVGIQIHIGTGGGRGDFAEVDEGVFTVGKMHRHEASATDIATAWVDDGLRVADSHGSIDGVAAHFQNIDADLRRQILRGDDHAIFGFHRGIRCGVQRQAGQHGQLDE
ncbi:hypothetical protein SRABI106_04408 [Rahnella aquatilis]|nr:hypothetical protein SRABI106_04408 [Rahnella aquatilis]